MEGRFSFMARFFLEWWDVRVGFEEGTGLFDDNDVDEETDFKDDKDDNDDEVDFNAEKDDDDARSAIK